MRWYLCCAVVLAGCASGPDYSGPPADPAAARRESFAQAGGIERGPVQATWWRAFGDSELDRIIETALAASSDIEAATARVEAARATVRERRGAAGLTAGVIAAVSRTRPSLAGFGVELPGVEPREIDLVEISIDASWEIDFAGRTRRSVERANAELQAQLAGVDDARVRVASEAAAAYFSLRAAERAIALAHEATKIEVQLLELVEVRRRLGAASDVDVTRAHALLVSTRSQLEPLLAERVVQAARLAALTGADRGSLGLQGGPALLPSAPKLQIDSPGELLRRRPDVRAAERRLAAATAGIGVANADLYPRISLLGTVGVQSAGFSNLDDGFTYRFGPSLSWNFLDLDRVRARMAHADAVRAERLALYKSSVSAALEDAETSLARFQRAQSEARMRLEALDSRRRATELAQTRQRLGTGSQIQVIEAERERLAAEREALNANQQVIAAFIRVQKAMGLAWQPGQLERQAQAEQAVTR
jgi:NodT family efflux transporter outer membrane factor (OMF) lipoprotein